MRCPYATKNNLEKNCSDSRWNWSDKTYWCGNLEVGKRVVVGRNSERLPEEREAFGQDSRAMEGMAVIVGF